jgi:hypothetical protein
MLSAHRPVFPHAQCQLGALCHINDAPVGSSLSSTVALKCTAIACGWAGGSGGLSWILGGRVRRATCVRSFLSPFLPDGVGHFTIRAGRVPSSARDTRPMHKWNSSLDRDACVEECESERRFGGQEDENGPHIQKPGQRLETRARSLSNVEGQSNWFGKRGPFDTTSLRR